MDQNQKDQNQKDQNQNQNQTAIFTDSNGVLVGGWTDWEQVLRPKIVAGYLDYIESLVENGGPAPGAVMTFGEFEKEYLERELLPVDDEDVRYFTRLWDEA